jgi:hypothetical protein
MNLANTAFYFWHVLSIVCAWVSEPILAAGNYCAKRAEEIVNEEDPWT